MSKCGDADGYMPYPQLGGQQPTAQHTCRCATTVRQPDIPLWYSSAKAHPQFAGWVCFCLASSCSAHRTLTDHPRAHPINGACGSITTLQTDAVKNEALGNTQELQRLVSRNTAPGRRWLGCQPCFMALALHVPAPAAATEAGGLLVACRPPTADVQPKVFGV